MSNKSKINQEYWENNIEGFSGFYDTKSEENILGNPLFTWLYKKILFPIEKKYMYKRHMLVSQFIDGHVKEGRTAADVGCGSGVYVLKMIQSNASFVYAYDYAKSAIELTKKNLKGVDLEKVEFKVFDITKQPIPKVDIVISIGVLPYIEDVDRYLENILPQSSNVFFNFLDADNLINRFRKSLGFLDVRKYSYHTMEEINNVLVKHQFILVNKIELATGWMLEVKKK
jgi:precorrin-6B methylase 2